MTRPASTKLTPEVTRELCQRTGSKAYISGSIGNLGSEYVLGLKVINCQNGDTLAQEQVTAASKEKVLDALGEAASKLRGELGESLATVQNLDVPLEQATTSSLEALKAFSLGVEAQEEKGDTAALPYYQRAIEIDPNFVTGYWSVGGMYLNLGEIERGREYVAKAFQLREHASEREKLIVAGIYYLYATGELDKAAQTLEQQTEIYKESGSYMTLGIVYMAQGKYDKAEDTIKKLKKWERDSVVLINLTVCALALQHFEEARQLIHESQAQGADTYEIHFHLYILAFLASDPAAMAEQLRWFADRPDYENVGLELASDTEAYQGHMSKSEELKKRAADSAMRADQKETAVQLVADAGLQQAAYGKVAEARRSATEALKRAPTSTYVWMEAALAFAMTGDTARSESLARDLGKRFPLDTQIQSLWLPAIQAQLALDRKNPAAALNALQAALPIELADDNRGTRGFFHVYVRGNAYLAAGQGTAAAAEFQKILDHSGIVWNCWTGALAHLGVARANALQSRTSQGADADAARTRALAAYKDFLTLWKDADPDIPILKEAKAEYAKLQ
jgi:tetratricopeptide (TPR) repeat protein